MSNNPDEYFESNYYRIDQKEFRRLNELSPPTDGLIRFLNGLEDHVFGVMVPQEPKTNQIHIFYAEYSNDFNAYAVTIPVEDHRLANDVTVVFAREIIILNPEKDFFDVFNTIQHHRQSALEALGYFTFNPFTAPKGTLVTTQKIIPIEKLNRVDFLKSIYENTNDKPHLDPENKIYLMLDDTNGLIKIGKSKNPKVRERTLQSEKPQTHIIAVWSAPAMIEKKLHNKYISKRKRGEWFRLSLNNLDEIKAYMDDL